MRPKRSDNKYWTGTRKFNHLQYESDLEDYISDLEVQNEQLHKHGVMQAEGSDVSEGAAVASEGEEKCVSDGHDETHVTIKDGDFEWCMACSRQVKRV